MRPIRLSDITGLLFTRWTAGQLAAALSLLVLFPCTLRADLALELEIGYGGRFLPGAWTPAAVTVVNSGQARTVCLRLITTSGSEWLRDTQQTVFDRTIRLPAFNTSRHMFTVPLETVIHPLVVRVLDREKTGVILERSVNLRPLAEKAPFVLMASQRWDGLPAALVPTDLAAVSVGPGDLADNPMAYDGVRAMLLDFSLLPLLSSHQWTALVQWVEQGGLIVALHGLQPETFRDARARELLPVRTRGLGGRLDASVLANWCGASPPDGGNLPLIGLASDTRWVALAQHGHPIVCIRPKGNGRVVVTAFDLRSPVFGRWRDRHLLWQRLAKPSASSTFSWRPDDQSTADLLLRHIGRRFPAFESALLLVCIYVFLVMAVARRSNGANGMLVLIALTLSAAAGIFVYRPAVTVPFAVSSFSVFSMQAGRPAGQLRQLITVAGFSPGTIQLEHPLRQGRLTAAASPQATDSEPMVWNAEIPMDASCALLPVPVWRWRGLRLNGSRAVTVDAAARELESNLQVRVVNRSSSPLLFPWVVWNNRMFLLEDLAPGVARRDVLVWDRGLRLHDPETRAAFMAPYEKRLPGYHMLKAAAALIAYDETPGEGAPFYAGNGGITVYGWFPDALAPLRTADGNTHTRGLTFTVIRVIPGTEEDGA